MASVQHCLDSDLHGNQIQRLFRHVQKQSSTETEEQHLNSGPKPLPIPGEHVHTIDIILGGLHRPLRRSVRGALLELMGCSQNHVPLLVLDYIKAKKTLGYQNGSLK